MTSRHTRHADSDSPSAQPAEQPAERSAVQSAEQSCGHPPKHTRSTMAVLRALHLRPTVARDVRYLTTYTGHSRRTVRAVLDRLMRCAWVSVQPATAPIAGSAPAEGHREGPSVPVRGRAGQLYQLTEAGAHAAGYLDHDTPLCVFWWHDPRSPRVVATHGDLDLVIPTTAVHCPALVIDGHDAVPETPWPMVEVTIGTSVAPALWYATTRQRGVLLWHDAATDTILAAHHPDVPAAPQPLTFTTPDGQHRTLGPRYTRLRAHDVRVALERWWDTQTPPDTLHWRPTRLEMPLCGR